MKKIIFLTFFVPLFFLGGQVSAAPITFNLDQSALPNEIRGTISDETDPSGAPNGAERINIIASTTSGAFCGGLVYVNQVFSCTLTPAPLPGDDLTINGGATKYVDGFQPSTVFDIFGVNGTSSGSGSSSGSSSGTSSGSSSKKKSSRIRYTCNDKNAVNYDYFGRHKQDLCEYTDKTHDFSAIDLMVSKDGFCPIFTQHLKKGDRDGNILLEKQRYANEIVANEVLLLQKVLTLLGYNEEGNEDGVFGEKTHRAVETFQRVYHRQVLAPWNLKQPTGRFYQSTNTILNGVLGCEIKTQLDNGYFLSFD